MNLTGDLQFTCNDCASMFMIRLEVVVNLTPIRYCPHCGTQNLTPRRVVLSEILKSRAFSGVDPVLVQMLYSEWASVDNNKLAWPRFIDYLAWQLENG